MPAIFFKKTSKMPFKALIYSECIIQRQSTAVVPKLFQSTTPLIHKLILSAPTVPHKKHYLKQEYAEPTTEDSNNNIKKSNKWTFIKNPIKTFQFNFFNKMINLIH